MKRPAPPHLIAKLFRGFGDPSRLSILLLLRTGPRRVSEVVDATGLSQPNASMHLACLWECGLVEREPQGRSVYYRVASSSVTQLLGLAEGILSAGGDRIECCPRYRGGHAQDVPGAQAVPRDRTRRRVRPRAATASRRPSAAGGVR